MEVTFVTEKSYIRISDELSVAGGGEEGRSIRVVLPDEPGQCSDRPVYGHVVGGRHVQQDADEAILTILCDLRWHLHAVALENLQMNGLPPGKSRNDDVADIVTSWSVGHLSLLVTCVGAFIDAMSENDAGALSQRIAGIKHLGILGLPVIARAMNAPWQGRRGAMIGRLLSSTKEVLDRCAQPDEIEALIVWKLTGVRPESLVTTGRIGRGLEGGAGEEE